MSSFDPFDDLESSPSPPPPRRRNRSLDQVLSSARPSSIEGSAAASSPSRPTRRRWFSRSIRSEVQPSGPNCSTLDPEAPDFVSSLKRKASSPSVKTSKAAQGSSKAASLCLNHADVPLIKSNDIFASGESMNRSAASAYLSDVAEISDD